MNGEIRRTEPTDDYEILQRVGTGTFGEVYKARHIRTSHFAAIKVVRLEAGENFALIQQEVSVLRDCVHQNIITYHGSYLRRDRLWIIMEYCSGGSLEDIYRMTGGLTELQIAFVCRETLKGLQYLHSRGKIHRDVKGANILLTNNGDVKLADFGIAAQISATLSKRKSMIGTPYWMAPEMASFENTGYGPECDVWAIGITSIELAEKEPPHNDIQPMQYLYLMTKASYKPPRLRDKYKWSGEFHDFVKNCLTKNPKKRPCPDKLLATSSFVSGALSPRLTRELLDRVNNEKRRRSSSVDPNSAALITQNTEKCPLTPHIEGNNLSEISTAYAQSDFVQSSEIDACFTFQQDHDDDDDNLSQDANNIHEDTERVHPHAKTRIHKIRNNRSMSLGRPSFRIGAAALIRGPFRALMVSRRRPNAASTSCSHPILNSLPSDSQSNHFGLLPTPQVCMGALFVTIMKNCTLNIRACASWTHPANQKQYLIIGADEGIYAFELTDLARDDSLKQISNSRCLWLYVIGDILIAMQGKTTYLYRHDILRLLQQEFITQKLSKTMTKLPDGIKPRIFRIRMPETRDCFQCCCERSVINQNLYMCCAVPNAMILFQWYDPHARFVLVKRVELDRLSTISTPLDEGRNKFYKPFSLIFGTTASNADFPMICIGASRVLHTMAPNNRNVSKRKGLSLAASSTHNHLAQNTEFSEKLNLDFINFNDSNNRLADADFVEKTFRNIDDENLSDEEDLTEQKFKISGLKRKRRLSVIALKQLDRDTLLIAYDKKVLIIDVEGNIKQTDLIQTTFTFDFEITHVIALPDSILAFHKHGIQAKSFFRGAVIQDLSDLTSLFNLISNSNDSIIVLTRKKCRTGPIICPQNQGMSSHEAVNTNEEIENFDLCVLSGHFSTLA